MTDISKIVKILFIAITLNIFVIFSLDYKAYLSDKTEEIKVKEAKSLSEIFFDSKYSKPSDFVIEKENNLLVVSGSFSSLDTLKELQSHLKINKNKDIKIDTKSRLNIEIINEISKVINFLYNYLEDGSKIVVNDNIVLLEGVVINNRYSNLVKLLTKELESNKFIIDIDTLEFN